MNNSTPMYETYSFIECIENSTMPVMKVSKSLKHTIMNWIKPLTFQEKVELHKSIYSMMEWLNTIYQIISSLGSELIRVDKTTARARLINLRHFMQKIKIKQHEKDWIIKACKKIIKKLDYLDSIIMVHKWASDIQTKWVKICAMAMNLEKILLKMLTDDGKQLNEVSADQSKTAAVSIVVN
ncbi:uncharacterized protein LOC126904828 [Daktulosphaira vitifoliae]|uniref:uncharacterized protein LOC126904826 n=1 Tax=Daktulosphaira vitifoliae TaxID=58002 RepID=UPI0021AA0D7B|nr:uncharacterized protein LOC126904826 [Daktulosphaira vitifoliae]XP_050540066.1 uncharacterized protein LOC126904827 [Daktulosphaira vitifoliae]XP_050540067.1 uncharacterized protein LOC126904828 [Daktulosphaira vitifoliae]